MATNRFDSMFGEADKAFNGKFGNEFRALRDLSEEDYHSIIPKTSGKEDYDRMCKIVNNASINHSSQADVVNDITAIGELAVKLAKKIPFLKEMF